MSGFDLRALLATLHDHDIRFVAIGGVAVGAHGFIRATEDLDIVPDPDPRNLDRLIDALAALETTLPTVGERPFEPTRDGSVLRRGGSITATTKFGGLDVVQLARGVPSYSELAHDAIEADLLGVPVAVCSLAHLRDMKLAQNRTQDKLDLENLPEP